MNKAMNVKNKAAFLSATTAPAFPLGRATTYVNPSMISRAKSNTRELQNDSKPILYVASAKTRSIALTIMLSLIGFNIIHLMVSTILAQGVYELAGLQAEQRALNVQKDILQTELSDKSSLASMDKAARDLGMIPSKKFNTINLTHPEKSFFHK